MHLPYRKLKLDLLAKEGVCFWCGILVKDYHPWPEGKREPDDMATIDHIKSRYFRKLGEVSTKVLSCNKCNQKRSEKENKIYGIKKMKWKS